MLPQNILGVYCLYRTYFYNNSITFICSHKSFPDFLALICKYPLNVDFGIGKSVLVHVKEPVVLQSNPV